MLLKLFVTSLAVTSALWRHLQPYWFSSYGKVFVPLIWQAKVRRYKEIWDTNRFYKNRNYDVFDSPIVGEKEITERPVLISDGTN